MSEPLTVKQALATASRLDNSDSPKLDCQILLAHLLDKDRSWLIAHDDYNLSQDQLQTFETNMTARQAGQPIAYIIGRQGFWSMDFKVNRHTLIPRPDTETLIETLLTLDLPPNSHIIDLGTGSGAIAISLASELPDASIYATDLSADALRIASHNNRQLCQGRVNFIQGHWLSSFAEKQFDVIVSNPPYIGPDDIHLPRLDAEPIGALVAEDHGFRDIKQIILQARSRLKPGAYLLLEHGFEQQIEVQHLLDESGYTDIQPLTDLSGQARCVLARNPLDAADI